jgi:hypothetical protein
VPPADHDRLAAAVAALIGSPARLAARGQAARARALQYSLEAQRDGYLEAYRAAAAHRASTRGDLCCAS